MGLGQFECVEEGIWSQDRYVGCVGRDMGFGDGWVGIGGGMRLGQFGWVQEGVLGQDSLGVWRKGYGVRIGMLVV